MKKFILIIVFISFSYNLSYASFFSLNDKFICRKDGVSSITKILETYYDKYVVLYTEFKGNKFLNLGTYTDKSLEFVSLEKTFLTANMITLDEELSYWMFVANLTAEEHIDLKKYTTKFDKVAGSKLKFNLTDDELLKELEFHNKKIEILGNILQSEKKVQNQGIATTTLICKIE